MPDNNSRADRGRDPLAWDNSRQAASDPLAELARLIGQSDYNAETDRYQDRHRDPDAGRSHEVAPAPNTDWATEDRYAERDRRGDERYAPPAPAPYESDAPQERGYENDEPSGGRFFSRPAATFNGFREEPDAYDHDAPAAALPAGQSPAYGTAEPRDDDYESGQPEYRREETYAADDYYDEAPRARRRSGLVGHGDARTGRRRYRRRIRLSRDVRRLRPADASPDYQGKQRSKQDRAGVPGQ